MWNASFMDEKKIEYIKNKQKHIDKIWDMWYDNIELIDKSFLSIVMKLNFTSK